MYLKDVVEKLENEVGFRSLESNLRMGASGYDLVIYTGNLEPFKDVEEDISKFSLEDYPFVIHTLYKGSKNHNFVFCEELNQTGVLSYLINLYTQEDDLEEFSVYFKGRRITYLLDLYSTKHNAGIYMTKAGYISKGVVKDRKVLEQKANLRFSEYNLLENAEIIKEGKIRDLKIQPMDLKIDNFGINKVLQIVQVGKNLDNPKDIDGEPTFFLTPLEASKFIKEQYQKNSDIKLAIIICDSIRGLDYINGRIVWPNDLEKFLS